jgi:triosephosphate isomerase (TIM)
MSNLTAGQRACIAWCMQSPYMIANWKMHGDLAAVADFSAALASASFNAITPVFCPPACFLHAAKAVTLGAQDCSVHAEGSYTGELSAGMLKNAGASYVIVGHSERRAALGETQASLLQKVHRALAVGLNPIFCVGETEDQRASGTTLEVLRQQCSGLEGLPVIVAYEPVWAIGSGKTPQPQEIAAAHAHLKHCLKEGRDNEIAVVYGGSVKLQNIREILAISGVDGALIGSASLNASDFISMCHVANEMNLHKA